MHGGGWPGTDEVKARRVFVLAIVVEFVLVWCWLWDVFCIDVGGVCRGMVDADGETVGIGFHHIFGSSELGAE